MNIQWTYSEYIVSLWEDSRLQFRIQIQIHHSKFKFTTANSNPPRQVQIHCDKFKFDAENSMVAYKCHGKTLQEQESKNFHCKSFQKNCKTSQIFLQTPQSELLQTPKQVLENNRAKSFAKTKAKLFTNITAKVFANIIAKVFPNITANVLASTTTKASGNIVVKVCQNKAAKVMETSRQKLVISWQKYIVRRKWILLWEIKVCQGLSFAKLEVTSSWVRIKLSWQRDTGEWIASQWRVEGNSPYIASVQYSGGGLYKTFVPMKWSRDTCSGWKCTTTAYFDWNLLGGWRLFGGSLGEFITWWWVTFKIVDGFVMAGDGGGGAGALREPMDSNRSFPVMSTLRIDFAAFEIFRHMLDFKSSMSCLGSG